MAGKPLWFFFLFYFYRCTADSIDAQGYAGPFDIEPPISGPAKSNTIGSSPPLPKQSSMTPLRVRGSQLLPQTLVRSYHEVSDPGQVFFFRYVTTRTAPSPTATYPDTSHFPERALTPSKKAQSDGFLSFSFPITRSFPDLSPECSSRSFETHYPKPSSVQSP